MNYIRVTSYHRSEVMTAQLIRVVMYGYTVSRHVLPRCRRGGA